MPLDHPPHETLRERLERDRSAINTLLADPATDDLVLEECLPNGDYAWLRVESEDPRYVLTDQGRRDLAKALWFDRGPTVADVRVGQAPPSS